jgi:hypothetical protein
MQNSAGDTNDSLYQAMLLQKQQNRHTQELQQVDVTESIATRKTRAEDARSVVTASTHYQTNARYPPHSTLLYFVIFLLE